MVATTTGYTRTLVQQALVLVPGRWQEFSTLQASNASSDYQNHEEPEVLEPENSINYIDVIDSFITTNG